MPSQVAGPAEGLILAIDLGTTNVKVLLVDPATDRVLRRASVPVDVFRPRPLWVEQDGAQLWDAVLAASAEALRDVAESSIAGVAISNQREAVAVWSDEGELLGPVLGWQDARTADWCAAPERGDLGERTVAVAGLPLDPMFSAPKLAWLLDSLQSPVPPRIGTLDTWLVHRLTGEYVAEAGNASRTLLLDLATLDYSDELLDAFAIPRGVLAPVVASDAGFGRVRSGLPIPAGVPVVAVLADSHAALYRHGAGRPGEGKATYGTGSSVMAPVAGGLPPAPTGSRGVARTVAWVTERPVYALEGNVVATGAAIDAVAALLTAGDVTELARLAEQAGPDSGLAFVPAFTGLGAPWFDRNAVPVLVGLGGGVSREQVALAAFEAVAHQVTDVVDAVDAVAPGSLSLIHADGGATASRLLMQLQADLIGRPVHVSSAAEASALGVAQLAATTLGLEVAPPEEGNRVVPDESQSWTSPSRQRWRTAVARSRGLAVNQNHQGES